MTRTNLAAAIDRLGELKAQIADLAKLEAEVKTELKELGPGSYEGEKYRVTISDSERDTLDMTAVREKLSAQFLRAHTTTSTVRSLRVTAR